MPRSFSERLAALEALEAEQESDPIALDVAALSDDALLGEVYAGLRSGMLAPRDRGVG